MGLQHLPMEEAVVARGVAKRFGAFQAVGDLSFRLARGEILALLGPNGAGKTTTVRLVASVLAPTAGTVRVFGWDTVQQPARVRAMTGLLTEAPGLYGRMRAPRYLSFFGQLYGLSREEGGRAAEAWLHRLGLWEARDLRLAEYSKGMRQKLALARALLHEPPLVLLDEPTSALDPAWAHRVHEIIRSLRARGHAILVCTHNLAEAEALADRVVVLQAGRVVLKARLSDLRTTSPGRRLMELRLACPVADAPALVARWVEVESSGDGWVRFWTDAPAQTNPPLLERLAAEGVPVVTLSEVRRDLEDIYLEVLGRADAGAAA